MKTPKEFFIEYGRKHFDSHKEEIEDVLKDPDIKFIFDAMEAFGKQEYNQAIDDSVANVKMYFTDLEQTSQDIDKESILQLKKS